MAWPWKASGNPCRRTPASATAVGIKPTDDGTTFLITENRGTEAGPAFITLNHNSTLKGVVLYYPNQKSDEPPAPYPYAVAMRGNNPAVLQVELLNPYNGIDATRNARHLIRDVSGQPLRRGVMVDGIYDIGRIENVHFNPWWSMSPKLLEWQMENGEAFVFGRTDWQYVFNTFCFGYRVGYRFIRDQRGHVQRQLPGLRRRRLLHGRGGGLRALGSAF